jgi:hypothetical protein
MLLGELYPDAIEAVTTFIPMLMKRPRDVAPEMPLTQLRTIVDKRFAWALQIDQSADGARYHFWYKSEENGENRRGERDLDPGVEWETFVDVVGAVQALSVALDDALAVDPNCTVGRFLLDEPDHAMIVSRVQMAAELPYTELCANVIDKEFRPCDAIRFFLSVLGIDLPDPASILWVRGVFFAGAPLATELADTAGRAGLPIDGSGYFAVAGGHR